MLEQTEKAWLALVGASTWEFPLAVQKWILGVKGGNQDVEDVALKAYHAWVTLANLNVDRFCQAKGFCELMTGSLNWLLQWQRLGSSISDSIAPGAMMGIRNGSRTEDRGLEEMVQRLGRDVRQLTARLNMQEGGSGFKTGQNGKKIGIAPSDDDTINQ
jgi:hypothetical protein